MARITGTQGAVKSGATVVASVTEFSLDQTADVVPDDVLGVTEKAFLVDRTGWTGSITVGWDKGDAGQATLAVGATFAVHLIPEGDAAGNIDWNGNIIVTAISMPVAAGAIVTQAVSVQGTGALAEDTIV